MQAEKKIAWSYEDKPRHETKLGSLVDSLGMIASTVYPKKATLYKCDNCGAITEHVHIHTFHATQVYLCSADCRKQFRFQLRRLVGNAIRSARSEAPLLTDVSLVSDS